MSAAYLLAVDPATTEAGFCYFEHGVPIGCFTVRGMTWEGGMEAVIHKAQKARLKIVPYALPDMVIERPDDWSREGKNIRALRMVWSVVYGLAASWCNMNPRVHSYVVPVSEWKGSRSKRSTSAEAALILKAEGIDTTLAKNEHERDALALGLWWLRHGKERELRDGI